MRLSWRISFCLWTNRNIKHRSNAKICATRHLSFSVQENCNPRDILNNFKKEISKWENSWHLQDIDPPAITWKETATLSLNRFHWTNSRSFSIYLVWDCPDVSVFACGQIKILSVAAIQRYVLLLQFSFIVYKKLQSHENSLRNEAKYVKDKFFGSLTNL